MAPARRVRQAAQGQHGLRLPDADVATPLDTLSRRPRFSGPEDFVFCADFGERLDDGRMRRDFYRTLDRAGLGHLRTQQNPIRVHDLRHTFGTLTVQAAPLSGVQAWMGHAHVQTTMIYVHYVPQHDAPDRLTRVFAASSDTLEKLTSYKPRLLLFVRCGSGPVARGDAHSRGNAPTGPAPEARASSSWGAASTAKMRP